MFINISNHPSAKWSAEQLTAAQELGGEVWDIAFPAVPTTATTAEIAVMADQISAQVADGEVAMIQGEFSLVWSLTSRIRNRGLRVVVACTDRRSVEVQKPDGTVEKTTVFVFAGFRDQE